MKYKIKAVASSCVRRKSRDEKFEMYERMIGIWRWSRHASYKIPMCFQGMNPSKRVGYIEPYETEAIMQDFPHWKFHVFTRLPSQKELILGYWWDLRKNFEKSKSIVIKECKFEWNICDEIINIILKYSKLSNEYGPPKLYFKVLKLIRDESYITINDKGDVCCHFCTIYHNNKVSTISNFSVYKSIMHKRSGDHKRALIRARKYYKELDYCS